MDYLLVSVAVLCIAASFTLTKAYQKHYAKGVGSLLFFPIPAAAVSVFFFLCLTAFNVEFSSFTVLMAFAYALVVTVYPILGLLIIRLGKLSVYMIFLMLGGMLIPFVYGVAFLEETLTAARIAGMVILTASLFAPFIRLKRNGPARDEAGAGANAPKGNLKLFIFLCVCVFMLNGCGSTISKVHQINGAALNTNQFLIWINLFIFILSASAFGVFKLYFYLRNKRGGAGTAQSGSANFTGSDLNLSADTAVRTQKNVMSIRLCIVLALFAAIALINCGGGILMMNGAKNLPASVLYPMVTGGTIVLTSLAGRIFYKEKINISLGAGLALTLIGTILFLF